MICYDICEVVTIIRSYEEKIEIEKKFQKISIMSL